MHDIASFGRWRDGLLARADQIAIADLVYAKALFVAGDLARRLK